MSDVANGTASASVPGSDLITQMLKEIIEAQKVQTSMLRRVLDAATQPIEGTSPVALALHALVASTNAQTDTMRALTTTMQGLPGQVSAAMKAEVDRALAEF